MNDPTFPRYRDAGFAERRAAVTENILRILRDANHLADWWQSGRDGGDESAPRPRKASRADFSASGPASTNGSGSSEADMLLGACTERFIGLARAKPVVAAIVAVAACAAAVYAIKVTSDED